MESVLDDDDFMESEMNLGAKVDRVAVGLKNA